MQPTCSEKGHLEQVAWNSIQSAFEHLHGRRFHSYPGKPIPVLDNPHCQTTFLLFKCNCLCFSLCPLPLLLSPGTTAKGLAPPSSFPPPGCLYTLIRSPCSLLQAEQSQLSRPLRLGQMLQSLSHLCGLLLDSLQYICPCLSGSGQPRSAPSSPGLSVSSVLSGRDGSCLWTSQQSSSPRSPGGCWLSWPRGHTADSCSAFCPPGPRVLLCRAASHQVVHLRPCPSVYWCLGLFVPGCRPLHFL